MPYLFNTPDQQQEMLQAIGVDSLEDLFSTIPSELRLNRPLDIPPALTEMELQAHVSKLAEKNVGPGSRVCMLGGGAYDHFIPAAVDEIARRGEFYTAYTPYQAEASQGSLQTFFEFQSLICQLTGMDVSNASLYEGGTCVSEAAFMAMRVTNRHDRVVLLGSLHPEYRQVVETYLTHLNCEVVVVPCVNGTADPADVEAAMNDQTACLVIQHPNFFGTLEEAEQLTEIAHKYGALSVVSYDPISLGILKRPGDYGADIAIAEGQSLGTPLQFGGPYLGLFSCSQKFVRRMPGRLIGQTVDRNGNLCYVLNLQAREQHIRRDKATSNICSNQGLIAIRAAVYLALLGKQGIREVAELSCQKAHYAAEQLSQIEGIDLLFADRPYFKEFVVSCSEGSDYLLRKARQAGFDLGPELSRFEFQNGSAPDQTGVLVAITEQRTREEIDRLVTALKA
ncbi:MAG: aminomethyl-transferring glycine dehydrogenase subunit GcvPA [Planctomycetes bacterium]|nr:aminomethyl-transferring glycine dehydrogenase subunit GcvPA [Planctomycetota bacterium]MCH9728029.1 aminomethyl-transferring glycine dehydrogenase subunit GcvPA [Planctomycetota bacterium]MCH9775831.1 aminomethyl-transferring glycine dehydrogenase subunit GcvPA [Planctomycetota bacterium]MCH9791093.1 aminomethyl-transferring glycine dehydrogenase subunit GcvPA [Planctomycetota bacterium]